MTTDRSTRGLDDLAIVGPTAAGKSALAMGLARQAGTAQILSVDSMCVYRGMDIGTAKPAPADRAEVPHHLLDLLDPHEDCSVAWFQDRAEEVRAATEAPLLLVGGTGLYHRAVVDRLAIPGRYPDVASELASLPSSELRSRLESMDPVAASRIDGENRRRLLRALEVTIGSGQRFSDFGPGLTAYRPASVVQVGLAIARADLSQRIEQRLAAQMDAGFLAEVEQIEGHGGWSRTSERALGYRQLLEHVRQERPLDDCLRSALIDTRRFAIRQQKWFGRDPRVRWFDADSPTLVAEVFKWWIRCSDIRRESSDVVGRLERSGGST